MAHMIATKRNAAGDFVSRHKPAWHGLGTVLDHDLSIAEALAKSGMDFVVAHKAIQTVEGESLHDFARATYRTDTNDILGVVGKNTHVLQNTEAFDLFAPFVADGRLRLETAGCLDEGRKVFILASSGAEEEIVKNDPVRGYLLLSNSHDGTMAVRLGLTPIRVVCWNTMSAAIGAKASKLIRIRHGSGVKENCNNIMKLLDAANMEFTATVAELRKLATKQIKQTDLLKYVKVVLATKAETKEQIAEALANPPLQADLGKRMENLIDKIVGYSENGIGQDIKGVGGTLWGAYNGVTQFLTHDRGHSQETRLASQWFGDAANINTRALAVALALAV